MSTYDVFNGDADGICGLHQLRLHAPRKATLITSVKRDIQLLERIEKTHRSNITVLDISLDVNRASLLKLLNQHNSIIYFDHHFAGEIPHSPKLETHIDTAPDVCTSILIDRFLEGRYRAWATAAAFGDNLHPAAHKLATSLHISEVQVQQLRELGELINYNSYGPTVEDLHFPPDQLYRMLADYADPWEFFHQSETLAQLRAGYHNDMQLAQSHTKTPLLHTRIGIVYHFPAEAWSRRVAGVFSNEMAREHPSLAHALLVDNGDKTFLVSVRAPLELPKGADRLCRQFPTGGGRAAAGGINQLPETEIDAFLKSFEMHFSQE